MQSKLRMIPREYQFMQHKGQLITKMRSFCITVQILKLKTMIDILFYEDEVTD